MEFLVKEELFPNDFEFGLPGCSTGASGRGNETCEFCLQNFSSESEKNLHIFEHFAQEICTNCDKRLVRIGRSLFVLHTAVTCVNANTELAKSASETLPLIEVTPSFPQNEVLFIKEEDGEMHENYSIDDKECNFNKQDPIGSSSKEKYSENSMVECTHDGCKKRIKSYMLHDHMINEHSVILKCHECGKICDTKSTFARHLQSHIEPDQLSCECCNLSLGKISKFGSRKELQMHMIRRHDPKRKAKDREYQNRTIKCPVEGCGEMVKKYNSATHQKVKHGMGTKCEICHRIFLTELSFKQHNKQHDENLSFSCELNECGTSFTSLRSLRMHMNTHSSTYQQNRAKTLTVKCDIDGCDMTIRKDKILVHRKELHGIGHRCKQCNELFEIESKLNEHILTHAMDSDQLSSLTGGMGHSIFSNSSGSKNDPIASIATLELVKCTFDGCSMRIEKHLLKNHMIKEHSVGLKCHVSECGEIFESRTQLLTHLQSHIDPKQFHTCSICNTALSFPTKFDSRSKLQMHMSKKHDPIRKERELKRKNSLIKCALCDDMIKRVNSSYHLREKHGVGIKCSICQKLCLNEASLKQHMRQHDGTEKAVCPICNVKFGTERGLKFHMNTHSLVYQLNRKRNTTIKCTIDDCNTMVRRGELHIEHLKVRHGIENKCADCGKLFVLESKLNGHIIMEHKMTIFTADDNNQVATCDVCQARVTDKNSFLEHLKEHFPTRMEPKKYECHCGKKLTSKQNLIEHDMQVHKNNLPKNFVCSACGKCFYKSSQLKRHERIHFTTKPFECNFPSCGKTFSKKASRDLHLHVHTKERPYKCDHLNCDRVYSYPIDLRKHKANVHGIWSQKIPCEQCQEVFPEKSKLRKHIQTMHGSDKLTS